MIRRLPLCIALATLAFGCSSPRIDTTTEESTAASIKKVTESLPEKDRQAFGAAILVVTMYGSGDTSSPAGPASAASRMKALNGKTAKEVLAEADKIRVEIKDKQRAQLAGEIRELEQRKTGAEKARAELARFEVVRSRLRMDTSGFMVQPVIDLTVKNGTGKAVSRAYFVGLLATPGRAVPWLQKEFNYEIPGGLEPGEGATWSLKPNMFSGWQVDAPKDAVFTATVQKLDGAGGAVLYDASWSSEDDERLDALRKQLATL